MSPAADLSNQRSSPRLPAPAALWLYCRRGVPGTGADVANGLLDVSAGGVQLLSTAALSAGEAVEVVLGAFGSSGRLCRAGDVRWAVPLGGDACCAGVQFRVPLTAAEVEMLTSARAPTHDGPDLFPELAGGVG